jgi:GMP synthase (glutamine-hydrolysing)
MTMRLRRAVVLRHLCFEDLGLLDSILARAGFEIAYLDAPIEPVDTPAARHADLLVILGGPIGAYDCERYPFLLDELRVIDLRLERDLPTLGICLGAQLMATALGSRVYPGREKEIGWGAVKLSAAGNASALAPLAKDGAKALHWHGDTFDLPAQATHLASTKLYENQAFQFGQNALALQFHIEADPLRIEQWLIGHACELAHAGISPQSIREEARLIRPNALQIAESVISGWIEFTSN